MTGPTKREVIDRLQGDTPTSDADEIDRLRSELAEVRKSRGYYRARGDTWKTRAEFNAEEIERLRSQWMTHGAMASEQQAEIARLRGIIRRARDEAKFYEPLDQNAVVQILDEADDQ